MYLPFEITDRGKFSFLECEKASSGSNLFFPDIWSTLSSNFLIVLFCFSHWSRSFASSCEDQTTLKMRQFGDTRLIFSFWQYSFYHMFCPRGLHFVDPIISLYLIPYYSYTYIAIKCTLEWEPFPPSSLHSPDLTRHMHKPRWRLYGRTWPRNGFRHHDCLAKYQFCLCSYNQQNAWN